MSTKKIWSGILHSRKLLIVIASIITVFVISLGCGAWIISEEKDVALSVNNNLMEVSTYANTVNELLKENEIDVADVSDVSAAFDSMLYDGQELAVEVLSDYKILVDGDAVKVRAAAQNVAEVLKEAGVTLGDNDTVEPELSTIAHEDMVIDVHRVTIEEEIRETELAYSVETKKDTTIVSGKRVLKQAGQYGFQRDTVRITYRDGVLFSEEIINSEVIEPVNEIIAVGAGSTSTASANDNNSESENSTASNGTDRTNSGTNNGTVTDTSVINGMSYSDVLTCKATAYHESEGSLTKSGTLSRVGAIAVDPRVIPLGTKLYVEGYGYCVAEDTGGLIKGNRIDVYFNSDAECITWGVKTVKVYILN